jgi:urease accessory protein
MRVVDRVLGNVADDPDLAAARDRHDSNGTLERVVLDDATRRRSRFRVRTDAGRELGVVVGDVTLEPGDVLADDDAMVVVAVASVPAASVELSDVADPVWLVEFGHAVGNLHRPLAVRDGAVHVALERGADAEPGADLRDVDPRLADALPSGVDATVKRVAPSTFDGSDARLRGQSHADAVAHDHSHAPHDHSNTDGSDRDS